jgi:hydroxyethylthiazole kinase-like uncharacterized protein yjeF
MSETLTADVLRRRPLPEPGPHSDKEKRGRVLMIGSCARVPGAALLSGTAALRAGAGKLQLAVPASLAVALGVAMPESGVIALEETAQGDPIGGDSLQKAATGADCVLLGPGLMEEEGAFAIARHLLAVDADPGFVLDAAALLRVLALRDDIGRRRDRVILTPHAGEMAALLGVDKHVVERDPEASARDLAGNLKCVVALKGSTTFVSDAHGSVWRNDHGAVGLGTCGSGDVLAGIIAGLLARGAGALDATLWGVFVHAHTGRRLTETVAPLGFLARELLPEIPKALHGLPASHGETLCAS